MVPPVAEVAAKPVHEWSSRFPTACTQELFEQQVARAPDAVALLSGDRKLTYRQLNERANQVAHYLRGMGVTPDALIGVSLARSLDMIVALLGVWKSGAAYVPLDPSYPHDRLAYMAKDAAVSLLLTQEAFRGVYADSGVATICLDTDWSTISYEKTDNPARSATQANLAYVMYTSGSTGMPKGAMITHQGLVNYLHWAISAYGFEAGGLVPLHSSVSFDLTVTSLYPALLVGGCVELLPEDVGAQSLLTALRQGKNYNVVKITPAHLELLTQQIEESEAPTAARAFVIGGENLTSESLRFWRKSAPATRLINEYGPTETVVGCCIYEVRPEDPQNGSVPIGCAIANTELYVLDEALKPVPAGEMGELYIGGAGVARGYWNRPELTAERFLPDTFSARPSARMYKSGDLARLRGDGVLEYLGRVDNQVKVSGYRIELGEIEAALAGQPQVYSCAVIVREDVPGAKQLVGYIVPRKGERPTANDIKRFLKDCLPEYMVPAQLVFLDVLPLTQNGKVDRKALPAPTQESASSDENYVAPATDTEVTLTEVLVGLLKVERIGIHDNIFDLGANSMLVLTLMSRIRGAFGVSIKMPVLFENPTVAQMAVALDKARGIVRPVEPTTAPKPAPQPVAENVAAAAPAPAPYPATPAPIDGHVIPFRFGPKGEELLGLYHRPLMDQDRKECCLLCNPFGQEAIRSHRVFRIIAERLAHSGFHVLRFDYFGTGDSAGGDHEGDIDRWVDDAIRANDELLRRSGCSRSSWFGLRLGATIAALASKRLSNAPRRLILWDPVMDGSAYLAELARAHVAGRSEGFELRWESDAKLRARVADETSGQALGYPLTDKLKATISALSPSSFVGVAAERIALFGANPGDGLSQAQQQMVAAAKEFRLVRMEMDTIWTVNEMLVDSIIPPQDIRNLIAALSDDR